MVKKFGLKDGSCFFKPFQCHCGRGERMFKGGKLPLDLRGPFVVGVIDCVAVVP
jgi:hypothetical protein